MLRLLAILWRGPWYILSMYIRIYCILHRSARDRSANGRSKGSSRRCSSITSNTASEDRIPIHLQVPLEGRAIAEVCHRVANCSCQPILSSHGTPMGVVKVNSKSRKHEKQLSVSNTQGLESTRGSVQVTQGGKVLGGNEGHPRCRINTVVI